MPRLAWVALAFLNLQWVSSSICSADVSCTTAASQEGSAMLQVQRAKADVSFPANSHKKQPSLAQTEARIDEEPHQAHRDEACDAQPRESPPDSSFQLGSLHDVVGHDGVLVISLLRKQHRFEYSMEKLKLAGIWPTEFAAADVQCLTDEELSKGCVHGGSETSAHSCEGRSAGTGCESVSEQAVAESHRRALVAAMERQRDWTAILEDDVVPVRPEIWNAAFEKAWKQVPGNVKMVRLSWCHFPAEVAWATLAHDSFGDTGDFQLANWTGYTWPTGRHYNPGLCTSAYMVHRDIIPEMLQLFPCCSAVDSCYLYDFFVKGWDTGTARGVEVMMHLDAEGSTDYAKGYQMDSMAQGGVMVQDTREIPSERES